MDTAIIMYRDAFDCAKAIEGIKNNNCFAETQLIIVNPYIADEDDLPQLVNGLKNVKVIDLPEANMAAAYNAGLKEANGEFINFTLSSAYLSDNLIDTVKKGYNELKEDGSPINLITVRSRRYTANIDDDGEETESYTGFRMQSLKPGLNNARTNARELNLLLQSYFIRSSVAKSITFNEDNTLSSDNEYLLNIIKTEYEYFNIQDCQYSFSIPLENSPILCEAAKSKEWYIPEIEKVYIPFIEGVEAEYGYIPAYLQVAALYFVWAKYNCNFFERNKDALTRDEAFAFDDLVNKFLSHIADNIIFQNMPCKYVISRSLKMHFYKGKCKALGIKPEGVKVIPVGKYENQLVLDNEEYKMRSRESLEKAEERSDVLDICTLGLTYNQKVVVKVIDFINGKIEIDAEFPPYLLDTADYKFYAKIDDKYIDCKESKLYSSEKFFGITINRRRTFHLSIPIDDLLNKKLVFGFTLDGKDYNVNYSFKRAYTKISDSNASYCKINKERVLIYKKGAISVKKLNPIKHLGLELKFAAYRLLKTKVPVKKRIACLFIRFIYWLCYPFLHNKHIWITFDKLYKAGDNGEYMFQYCHKINCQAEVYYVISKDSLDYQRLKAQHGKYILIQGSIKLRIYALFSEVILATHSTVFNYLGFDSKARVFFIDLFKAVIVCIQHGLTIQKIAQYQNRVFDDTRLYTLASKYEKENCEKPPYDFFGPELKLTGLARYDGLKSNDQKQILITPTWRRNVVNQGIAFIKKTHNDTFKGSEYFRLYNNLINDEALIENAKKNGYKIIYLLHPAMSSQAEDFDKNDYVEIMQATGDMSYEKILTESSLMVTDYSGVQFDFAYQRKPIVYYHPDTLPPQYEAGGLVYETMGFGPICSNHETLITTLCNYMDNQCKTEQLYVERSDDFFYYDDFNNCERIYNEVVAFLANKSNFLNV